MSRLSASAVASASAPVLAAADPASAVVAAARLLLRHLEHGHRIDAPMLRAAMETGRLRLYHIPARFMEDDHDA